MSSNIKNNCINIGCRVICVLPGWHYINHQNVKMFFNGNLTYILYDLLLCWIQYLLDKLQFLCARNTNFPSYPLEIEQKYPLKSDIWQGKSEFTKTPWVQYPIWRPHIQRRGERWRNKLFISISDTKPQINIEQWRVRAIWKQW